jgi:GTP cyclohydrolase II
MIEFYAKATIPTKYGEFEMYIFKEEKTNGREITLEHLAIFKNYDEELPLVRVHSKCLTGEVFGSLRCDCGPQLDIALSTIGQVGGILVYLDQEGRGIGLANKIRAYSLQDKGYDTVQANIALGFKPDERNFAPAAFILEYFRVKALALLTNNPDKIEQLKKYGFEVERIPIFVGATPHSENYLLTKEKEMGHLIEQKKIATPDDIIRSYREIVRKRTNREKKKEEKRISLPTKQTR